MAWRCGSLSRSLLGTARATSLHSSPSLPRLRPPPLAAPRLQRRGLSFAHPRSLGELGCTQSLLPLNCVAAVPRLTSYLSVSVRACCELAQEIGIEIDREKWKRWVMREASDHWNARE